MTWPGVKLNIAEMMTTCWLKLLPGVAAFVLVCGCKTTNVRSLAAENPDSLQANTKVFLAIPPDGSYGSQNYGGSGQIVAGAFEAALLRHTSFVVTERVPNDPVEVITKARECGCSVAIVPRITQWEDRATEWSGKRDKLGIVVRVADVATGATMRSAELTGKSAWLTLGGDHPQDLLTKPVGEFIDSLFK